jgi:HEPN domain-containing protein
MSKANALTLGDLAGIDELYSKATKILDEANAHTKTYDWDLTVRRSQEAFELYLKSLFRYVQREYPRDHDLKKQIYELTQALKESEVDRRRVARLVLANSLLSLWRSPAFYGDETLNISGLFDEGEARLALSYAQSAQFVCSIVRGSVYTGLFCCLRPNGVDALRPDAGFRNHTLQREHSIWQAAGCHSSGKFRWS